MSTQELLNTMVASQIQLREDMNLMVQQFQNMKNDQEGEKTNQISFIVEHEKRINEKMNKMEEIIKRSRRLDDLIDYRSLSLFPDVRLPPKFKMPILDKFDGTGCPKSHLKMYTRAMQPLGATEEMLVQMFQNTLTRAALRWFLNVEDTRTQNWEDICKEFHNQYKCNIEVDITTRNLETTKQGPKESFSSFITKWRAKAAQMIMRPSEEDQIQMVVKNLLPIFHKHLFSQYFPNFKAFVIAGTQVEDAINNGMLKKEELSIF